jgi:hypothetical protein
VTNSSEPGQAGSRPRISPTGAGSVKAAGWACEGWFTGGLSKAVGWMHQAVVVARWAMPA